MTEHTEKETVSEFKHLVNMTAKKLEEFLDSDESKSVGWAETPKSESVGHKSGKKIVKLLGQKGEFSTEDLEHMRKVIGYIKRHLAQKPEKEDIEDSRWRYSLMNWGHDPLKKSAKSSATH